MASAVTMIQYGADPEYSCRGKRNYASSSAAKRAGRQTMTRIGGRPIRPYHCRYCGWWHNGHVSVVGREMVSRQTRGTA